MPIRLLASLLLLGGMAHAAEIQTNELVVHDAPSWVTESRLDRVVAGIQNKLEWDIRKIQVHWYQDEAAFEKAHQLGSSAVLAFSRKQDQSVHVGPRVTRDTFDSVFGHELVHIILYQKYKDAIPLWLDEGLANYVARHGAIDYAWLAIQPESDVHSLAHPFAAGGPMPGAVRVKYCYQASTALMEMIASKCALSDILQLSLGSKLENYLSTLCGISDINAEFKRWVAKKAGHR